jgi:hypothetical protein
MHEAQIRLAREQSELYGDTASRLSAFSGLASNLSGAAGERLMIAADILDAVEATKLMGAEMPALISQLGGTRLELTALTVTAAAVTVAVIAVTSALKDLADANERNTQIVQGQISASREYHNFIADANAEDVRQRMADIEKEQAVTLAFRSDLEELHAAIERGLDVSDQGIVAQLSEGALRAFDALGGNLAGLDDIRNAYDENSIKLQELTILHQMYTDALTDGTLAENDAREQARIATEQQIASLERVAQLHSEAAELLRTGTSDAVEGQIQGIQDEIAAKQFLIGELKAMEDSTGAAAERAQALENELELLQEREGWLLNSILPIIKAREDETEAAKKFLSGLRDNVQSLAQSVTDTVQRFHDGAQLFADLETKTADLQAETAQKITESTTKYNADRIKLVDNFNREQAKRTQEYLDSLTEMRAEHNDTVREINADAAKEDKRAREEYLRDVAKRERQHRSSLLDAAAHLDAEAVDQENRRYADEQTEAEIAYKAEAQQREEQRREQLQAESRSFNQRQQQAQRAYNAMIREQQAALAARLTNMRNAHYAELNKIRESERVKMATLNAEHTRQLQELGGFLQNETSIKQAHYRAYLSWLASQRPPTGASSSQTRSVGSTLLSGLRNLLPSFDTGGYTPGGAINTHPGEFVTSPETTRALERGLGQPLTQQNVQNMASSRQSINVNQTFNDVGSYTPTQLENITYRAITKVMQQAAG